MGRRIIEFTPRGNGNLSNYRQVPSTNFFASPANLGHSVLESLIPFWSPMIAVSLEKDSVNINIICAWTSVELVVEEEPPTLDEVKLDTIRGGVVFKPGVTPEIGLSGDECGAVSWTEVLDVEQK
jgi:hypothetical protein